MYPLHDKDLDRLSRDAAEHYEVDSGPSGWEQLEKRLDQELPQQRGRRRFLFWLFFIVVSTGSALIGLLINSQPVTPLAANIQAIAPVNRTPAALNNPTEEHTKTNNTVAGKNPAGHTIDKPAADAGTPSTDTPLKAITHDGPRSNKQESTAGNSVEPTPADQLQSSNSNKPVTVSGNNKTGQPRNKPGIRNRSRGNNIMTAPVTTQPFGLNRHKGNKNLVKKPTAINDQPFVQTNDLAATPDKNNNQGAAITQEPVTTPATGEQANETNATTAAPNTTKPAVATDSAATSVKQKDPSDKKTPSPKRYFELGLVAGPDASMVEFGPLYKSGYNFGLQVGYRMSDRWSVNTGAIYTKRFYKADSGQVHPPKHSQMAYDDSIRNFEGYCVMLDIPVNVRYDFSLSDKRRFFASAGISSYLMSSQYYEYDYRKPTGEAGHKGIPWEKDEKYFFSVLNLSVGYERTLSDRFSIQAEPYLKVPLTGLGYGNMKMGSYGMFFSLKYRPTFGSKKAALKK